MSKIQRFDELTAWQRARELTKEIYSVTNKGDFGKDYGLRDQIRRASVSIMSNVAEGFDRAGRAEFHQFLVIAKSSCAEVRSHLYVAFDAGYLTEQVFQRLLLMADELGRIVNGLRAAVQKQRDSQRS